MVNIIFYHMSLIFIFFMIMREKKWLFYVFFYNYLLFETWLSLIFSFSDS